MPRERRDASPDYWWQPFVKRFHGGRLSRYLNVVVPSRHGAREVRVPLLGGVGFDNLSPGEPWMDRLLSVLLPARPGAFIDVGVNVGQTLLKVRAIDPARPYIGFEPNPVCHSYTQRLIAENGFEDCTVLPIGLSNDARVVSFFTRHDSDVSGSTVEGFRGAQHYSQMRHVAVFTGDAMLASLGNPPVAVLKVDVEGAELEVLEGFSATLATQPFVICEILPLFTTDGPKGRFRKPRQDKLLEMMRERGFALYRVLPDASVAALDDIAVHGDLTMTNYLFAPRAQRSFIESRFDHVATAAAPREGRGTAAVQG